MKLLRRKEGPSLDTRLAALLEAATLGEGRLSEQAVSGARAVAERAGVRRRLSIDHTVAALAGATGSGKSSLYNALAGEELADVGVTRPTTSTAQAALWDGEGSGPLLDWLDIPQRHSTTTEADFSGLVLLDLPDHDSIRLSHRLEVDRLVELVDLLVWVVDPQKYADAALHERYLRPLAGHRDVMLVVLNQVDRLPAQAVERCLRDLRRLLDEDGLTGVPVLAVSARTGTGLNELRTLLGDRVSERKSWSARLAADITAAADHLATAGPATGEGQVARSWSREVKGADDAAAAGVAVDAVDARTDAEPGRPAAAAATPDGPPAPVEGPVATPEGLRSASGGAEPGGVAAGRSAAGSAESGVVAAGRAAAGRAASGGAAGAGVSGAGAADAVVCLLYPS
ncbi:YfjP family GTPase, partial [Nonomuraea zeae]|uniref:YfjP family GTPase n=1 Tax=Nonomuraea zeae TaxID=1642303 RepID=UPI001F0E26B5